MQQANSLAWNMFPPSNSNYNRLSNGSGWKSRRSLHSSLNEREVISSNSTSCLPPLSRMHSNRSLSWPQAPRLELVSEKYLVDGQVRIYRFRRHLTGLNLLSYWVITGIENKLWRVVVKACQEISLLKRLINK